MKYPIHYMGQNGVTYCGKSDVSAYASIILEEITCRSCLARIIANKYKSAVTHSDVPIYLDHNVTNAMMDFVDELKERKMIFDDAPPPEHGQSIHVYFKDRPFDPFTIIPAKEIQFREIENYTVLFKEVDGKDVLFFVAPTENILCFKTKLNVKHYERSK